ncbi:hypothetical protein ACFX11_027902 [Malus domestica]
MTNSLLRIGGVEGDLYRIVETPLTEPSHSPFRTISHSAPEEVHSQITLKGLSLCLSGILGLLKLRRN